MRQTSLGATPLDGGRCRFRVWAPEAERVEVVLADGRSEVLRPAPRGYHEAVLDGVSAGERYRYRLDGGPERPDPASRFQPEGVHGPSEVVDPAAFAWSDEAWRGVPLRDLVLYELHVGTFSEEGTFEAAIAHLDDLVDLGVTAIELMPVAQFPGGRNWGYDGVDLWAPQSTYGGPDGLRRLVDAAHARGVAVVLDVVYNHLGPEGNYLRDFGPYFTRRYQTPWGDAVNVDGPGSDEVRAFFVGNALMWLSEYHLDALRLDAIHGIVDTSASPFLGELADAVADLGERLGRRRHLIAESDLNDVRVVTPRAAGGLGHDAQWCDDFHHAVHSVVTGEGNGYYADFGTLDHLAAAYVDGVVYDGRYSAFRGRRHGSSFALVAPERLVVYAQNHDQIGNRLLGDRLSATLDPASQRLVAGLVLLSPFTPMLFMGEEWGETAPFPYFVSHTDAELVEAVRRGRREEFASFGWEGEAPDPQGEETFASARLDRTLREREPHRGLRELHRELLRLRRERPELTRFDQQETSDRDEGDPVLSVRRSDETGESLAVFNLAERPAAVDLPGTGWTVLVDSADERFGGPGAAAPAEDSAMVAARSFLLLGRGAA